MKFVEVHQICYAFEKRRKNIPTKNPRLNVVLDNDLYDTLSKLAHKDGVSLSLKARDLLKEALMLYEDAYWEKITQERENTFSYKNALSYEDVWK